MTEYVGFDWKTSPEDVIRDVNEALDEASSGWKFVRVDDGCGDSTEFALVGPNEKALTPEEYRREMYGDDDDDG